MSRMTIIIVFLGLYVLGIIGVGIRNRKSKTSTDYFLASRQLPAWLLSITFIASWWGGGSAIDLVDHAYRDGLSTFWIYGVPVLIATALLFIFAKGIRNIGTLSQPQLMKERYNRTVSLLLTIFIIIFMVLASAVQVIVVGKFFQEFFGISYALGATLGTGIVLIYSLFGGFKGVVLTDFLQFLFFLFTAVFLFYLAYDKSGGMEAVKTLATEQDKPNYASFFHNVSDNLAYVITFGISWMIQANIWQRVSAAKKAKDARKMMAISFVAFIPLYLMVTYTGMFSSVFFDGVPKSGIVPTVINGLSSPVLSALLFVGLCSAIMSTMDSLINTGALSLTVDIYQHYISPSDNTKRNILIARLSTFIMGAIALGIAINIKSVLKISWIGSDFLTCGAFVPLVLGFLWSKGNAKAAVVSMLFGLLFSAYNLMAALGLDLPVAWEIASAKQAIIGISVSLLLFVVISLSTKTDQAGNLRFIRKANVLNK